MLETILASLSILGISAVVLLIATIVALAVRSTGGEAPRQIGTIDLAGTAAPTGARVTEGMESLAGSLSSLHRRLPSPEAAMGTLPDGNRRNQPGHGPREASR